MKKLVFKNGETIVKIRMSGNHWRKVRVIFYPDFFNSTGEMLNRYQPRFPLNLENPYIIERLYGKDDHIYSIQQCATYFKCVSELNQEMGKVVFEVPGDPRLLEIDRKLMTVQIKLQEFIDDFSETMDEELDGDIVEEIQEHLREIENTRLMILNLKLA